VGVRVLPVAGTNGADEAMMDQRRRVVVTGMGAVGPLGLEIESIWDALLQGRSGIGPISLFDHSAHYVHIAGEARAFDPSVLLGRRAVRRTDRFTQFALVAAARAVADAGLDFDREDATRIGVLIGTGLCGMTEIEAQKERLASKGPGQVMPLLVPKMMGNAASAQVAIAHGLRGPNFCVITACASGNHALGEAARLIQYGEADVVLAGSSEAPITPLMVAGFANMGALARWPGLPETASRPFDKDRCGFVIAEGAGVLVLEDLGRARRRGARIHAEVGGYGRTGDATHITTPCADGEGACRAMRLALRDAGLGADGIDYVNAHGTSTLFNDKAETVALKRVLGERAKRIPVSSTKSMTGHMLAAAGAFEAVVAVLSVRDGKVHATRNLETPDPECDLDYVPEGARELPVRAALSNSMGFGGHNAALIFKKFDG